MLVSQIKEELAHEFSDFFQAHPEYLSYPYNWADNLSTIVDVWMTGDYYLLVMIWQSLGMPEPNYYPSEPMTLENHIDRAIRDWAWDFLYSFGKRFETARAI